MERYGKNRIYGWDVIRIVSAFLVTLAHLSETVFNQYGVQSMFLRNANGDYGALAATAFFILSGAALALTTPRIGNGEELKQFYRKRIKAIFPMFLFLWVVLYVAISIRERNLLWGGEPWTMILTLIGMDGYLLYLIPNYYIIGEWFLGALVLLYLLYPALLWLFTRYRLAATAGILILYILLMLYNPFRMHPSANPVSCLTMFWIGMLLCAYREKVYAGISRPAVCGALVLLLFALLLIPLPVGPVPAMHLAGILTFLILWKVGDLIASGEEARRAVTKMSDGTYAVFLLQHILIGVVFYRIFEIAFLRNAVMLNIMCLAASVVIFLCGVIFNGIWIGGWRMIGRNGLKKEKKHV